MIVDAKLISTLQSCPRKLLLESDWEVLRWKPKLLLDACLRRAIAQITNGKSPADAADSAKADYLQIAANPGLDLPYGANPYVIAKDYCSLLDTILRVSATWALPKLSDHPPVQLSGSVSWQPLAYTDGVSLHRIITIDRWTEEDFAREVHGWYVFGDIVATQLPLTLHVIEIGQTRDGRRASPFARAWQHPTMPTLKLRFRHKDGSTFKGWTAVYLADHRDISIEDWVGTMAREGVCDSLVRHLPITVPSESVISDTRSQILLEATRMSVLLSERRSTGWRATPMSRGSCDRPGDVCPFQYACHQDVTDLASLGLYRIRNSVSLTTARM